MKTAITSGYASLDFAVGLDGYYKVGHTTIINDRSSNPWPHPGGCALYTSKPIAAAGHCSKVLTWIGNDQHGEMYTKEAANRLIDTSAIAVVEGGATPVCMLIYEEDGSCTCLFDPGFIGQEQLTAAQEEAVRKADMLCITVGPPQIGERLVELISVDAIVAWVAKNDEISFPASLRKALGMRADYIFCNPTEREVINEAIKGRTKSAPIIVETGGTDEVSIEEEGRSLGSLSVSSLKVIDTTGAGDTLAGGTLAAVLSGETGMKVAVQKGIDAAYQLLLPRSAD